MAWLPVHRWWCLSSHSAIHILRPHHHLSTSFGVSIDLIPSFIPVVLVASTSYLPIVLIRCPLPTYINYRSKTAGRGVHGRIVKYQSIPPTVRPITYLSHHNPTATTCRPTYGYLPCLPRGSCAFLGNNGGPYGPYLSYWTSLRSGLCTYVSNKQATGTESGPGQRRWMQGCCAASRMPPCVSRLPACPSACRRCLPITGHIPTYPRIYLPAY
ncbi:hypothetical protein V8F06_001093 [Rhypophila decipiens]